MERTWEEGKLEAEYERHFLSDAEREASDSGLWTPNSFLDSTLRADLATWLPDDLLLKVDRMTMAAGLEARVPYLDHRVVELALRMPAGLKVRNRSGKWILKEAAEGLVPGWVRKRKKHGLDVPIGSWLRGPLKDALTGTLTSKRCRERGLFNPKGVDGLLADHFSQRADYGLTLWGMLVLEQWVASRVDRN